MIDPQLFCKENQSMLIKHCPPMCNISLDVHFPLFPPMQCNLFSVYLSNQCFQVLLQVNEPRHAHTASQDRDAGRAARRGACTIGPTLKNVNVGSWKTKSSLRSGIQSLSRFFYLYGKAGKQAFYTYFLPLYLLSSPPQQILSLVRTVDRNGWGKCSYIWKSLWVKDSSGWQIMLNSHHAQPPRSYSSRD